MKKLTGISWTVRYKGFLQEVVRPFKSRRDALQWVRQVGKEKEATITKETA